MNGAQTLRPTQQVSGVFIALIGKRYDFEKDGERRQGVSYLAHVAESNDAGEIVAVHALKVSNRLNGAVAACEFGQEVVVDLSGFSRMSNGRAVIEWNVARIYDGKTGELIAADSQLVAA